MLHWKLEETCQKLETNKGLLIPMRAKRDQLQVHVRELPGLEEKLKGYASPSDEDAKKIDLAHQHKALRDRESKALEVTLTAIKERHAEAKAFKGAFAKDVEETIDEELLAGPNRILMNRAVRELSAAASDVDAKITDALNTLAKAFKLIQAIQTELKTLQDTQEIEFRKVLELHKANQAKSAERTKLEKSRNDLLFKKRELVEVEKQIGKHMAERDALLDALCERRDERSDLRQKVASRLNDALMPDIKVQVRQYGDRAEYRDYLASCLKNEGIQNREAAKNISTRNRPAPALNSLALVLSTAGPRSAFLAHTHTLAQIIGLLDALAGVYARLEYIENILPHATPGVLTARSKSTEIPIPDKAEVYPGRFAAAGTAIADPSKLKPGGLLPAIHDATIANITVPLPDVLANAGNVFLNDTGVDIAIPGGLGRRSSILQPGGFAASDGRVWYRVTRDSVTHSFFPTDFERTPMPPLYINEQQVRAGGRFTLEFDLELQLINAGTNAQVLLVIEAGTAPSQGTPDPTGTNLENLEWDAVPVLSQRIIVTALKLKHHFGCAFKRSLDGLSMSADRLLYDVWTGGAHAPVSPSFALRARLIQFDTENSVAGAKGLVSYAFSAAAAAIKNA